MDEKIEKLIQKFASIEKEARNSSWSERISTEIHEATPQEFESFMEELGLPMPEYYKKSTREFILPTYIWNELYENYDDVSSEKYEEITKTESYKLIVEKYFDAYREVKRMADEISAFYTREHNEVEAYYDAIRYEHLR
jgi:hypothetical protein